MRLLGEAAGLFRRVGAISLSIGARGVFGLILAGVIVSRYPPAFSIEFFQLLLLQSIFLTFVSGSGYAHAVAASETDDGALELTRNYLAFLALTLVVAIAVERLAPRALIARTVSPDRWKIELLMAGGASISLHGILQGVLVRRIGALRAFLPTSVAGLLAAGVLLAYPRLPPGAMFAVFVGYQVCSLVLLIVSSPEALRLLARAARPGGAPIRPVASARVFAIALINTAYLLIFFTYRDQWSSRVPALQSQGAFFGLRLSDTYLQILVLSAAQSNPLRVKRGERAGRFGLGLAGGAGLAAVTAFATLGVLWAPLAGPLIVRCVAAQLVCEAVRIPASLANMAELQTGKPWRYALTSLPPIAAAYLLASTWPKPAGLENIYAFQLVTAALQIAAYCGIGLWSRFATKGIEPLRVEPRRRSWMER